MFNRGVGQTPLTCDRAAPEQSDAFRGVSTIGTGSRHAEDAGVLEQNCLFGLLDLKSSSKAVPAEGSGSSPPGGSSAAPAVVPSVPVEAKALDKVGPDIYPVAESSPPAASKAPLEAPQGTCF